MRSGCSLSEGSLRFQGYSTAGRGNAAYARSFRRDGTDSVNEVRNYLELASLKLIADLV